jgi:hypothetical protein
MRVECLCVCFQGRILSNAADELLSYPLYNDHEALQARG